MIILNKEIDSTFLEKIKTTLTRTYWIPKGMHIVKVDPKSSQNIIFLSYIIYNIYNYLIYLYVYCSVCVCLYIYITFGI